MDKVITIYYQNCRGLRSKLHMLYMNVLQYEYDIIVFTETWLHNEIFDSEIIDNRYQLYRCDRDRVASGRGDGGGVLIAVRHGLSTCAGGMSVRPLGCGSLTGFGPAHSPLTAPNAIIDHITLEIHIETQKYIVGAVYIPPNLCADIYNGYFDYMQEILQDRSCCNFCIVGDFNLPGIEWVNKGKFMEPNTFLNCNQSCRYLLNFLSFLSCYQINSYKNKKNKILDLFLTNIDDCSTAPVALPLVPFDEYHPPFCVKLLSLSKCGLSNIICHKPFSCYNYKNADYEIINRLISETNWDELLNKKSSEVAANIFYETIFSIIRKHVPSKVIKSNSYPIWFNTSLIHIFKNKNRAWIKWKKYNNVSDYQTFSIFRERFKVESDLRYKAYINLVECSIKKNVKYFWTYVASRRPRDSIPNTVAYKNKLVSDPLSICNMFSEFFLSVFVPSDLTVNFRIEDLDSMCNDNNNSDNNICDIVLTGHDIKKQLNNLDTTKGPGTDNLPAIFLKNTAETIYKPLHILFNRCLSEGIFPNVWKAARIVPVYKGGPKQNVENYRPISILPTVSKIFERLVHRAIYPSLHNIIIPQQHGFVQRRSTVTNLLIYTNYLFDNMDSNKQTDSIYTDFQKAFDRVDHKRLLEKIAFNGIRGNLLRWFKSYITNRTQKIVIKGYESETVRISSGVPQGSILGPLLFILYINDISNCFKFCNFLLYADDLKIYHKIECTLDIESFQGDLDRFTTYCTENKLSLSLNKCKKVTFTKKKSYFGHSYELCGVKLDTVDTIRDLGVTLDSKLHLDTHVESIINKAFRSYGFVMRSSVEFKMPSSFLILYKSLIRSQLEYAVPIWNPYYKKYTLNIERVQKKFLRCVNYRCKGYKIKYDQLLEKYNLLDLHSRRQQLECMTLYDLCNNRYDCSDIVNSISYKVPNRVHMRSSRIHHLFATNKCHTNAGKRSPLFRLKNSFNNTFNEIDIHGTRVGTFKKLIINKLKQINNNNNS